MNNYSIGFCWKGYNWTVILPAELSAAAVIINYWYVFTQRFVSSQYATQLNL